MRGVPLLYAVHSGSADGVLDMEPILAYAFAEQVCGAAIYERRMRGYD